MKEPFSAWKKWNERNTLAGINYPGVYALAISPDDISTEPFDWRPEIAYIGMTNSKGGLKSRLQQFDNTVKKEDGAGHGGGARVRNRYPDYHLLNSQLYVSVCSQRCDASSNSPHDLRLMGEVAYYEYECIATYRERFGNLPEFNDKLRSPKK